MPKPTATVYRGYTAEDLDKEYDVVAAVGVDPVAPKSLA